MTLKHSLFGVLAVLLAAVLCIAPAAAAESTCDHSTWTAWTETTELPSTAGSYYLLNDVNISQTWTVPAGETSLCLNGYDIMFVGENGSVLNVSSDTTFNLYDCIGTGKITGGNIVDQHVSRGGGVTLLGGTFNMYGGSITGNSAGAHGDGGGIYISDGAFTLFNGSITDNSAGCSDDSGGGIYISANGTATMFGGSISDNHAAWGGGVAVYGTFAMFGGSISDNTAYMSGGGLHIQFGTFTMSGGDITGNVACMFGGGINNAGTVIMTGGNITGNEGGYSGSYGSGVSVSRDCTFTLSGLVNISGNEKSNLFLFPQSGTNSGGLCVINASGFMEGAKIGITTETVPTALTSTNNADYSRFFFADNSSHKIENIDNVLYLAVNNTEPTTYTTTITTSGNGTASAAPNPATAGTPITLTATPDTGYIFKEWQVLSGGVDIAADNTFTMPASDVEIQAVFEPEEIPEFVSGQTVFLYEKVKGLTGTWTYGAMVLTAQQTTDGYGYFYTGNLVEGKYRNGDDSVIVRYPTATITGIAGSPAYFVENEHGHVARGDDLTITATSLSENVDIDGLLITYPDGVVVKKDYNAETGLTLPYEELPVGNYQIQALFEENNFVEGTPQTALISKNTYTFHVTDLAYISLSVNPSPAFLGEIVTATINGTPGETCTIYPGELFEISSFGTLTPNGNSFVMPNTGTATIYLKATTMGDGEIWVNNSNAEAGTMISVVDSTLTARNYQDSYYIGDDVILYGTTMENASLYFYIKGLNYPFTQISVLEAPVDSYWTNILPGDTFGRIDAGTYTIYVSTTANAKSVSDLGLYADVVAVFKQPFITITDAPAVATKETTYTVKGIAEATDVVQYYIFGVNYFETLRTAVEEDSSFIINMDIPATLAAGQYFMVVQHPMYDKYFNIAADGTKIVQNLYGDAADTPATADNTLFDVADRQYANAAQALCDELDSQAIDDMYVKLTFIVAAPTSVINPIPSEIVKGAQLVVSGSTNIGGGQLVTVEMISTAFAAVPKETVGSASFISHTTTTDENGNWEVTFDTSGLNIDEYTISVFVQGIDGTASARINVVEGIKPDTIPTSITLKAGWNFISVPKYLNTSLDTAAELLGHLSSNGLSHLGYDAETKSWYSLAADTKIEPLDAYWVYTVEPATITLGYSEKINTPPVKTLYRGWNAVGLSAETSMTAKSAFSNLDWGRYLPWDIGSGKWGTVIVNGGSTENSEELKLTLGNGGWVYVNADGTYLGNTA